MLVRVGACICTVRAAVHTDLLLVWLFPKNVYSFVHEPPSHLSSYRNDSVVVFNKLF
jgi:hypothetical protein